jgi:hypothetical protein
MVAPVMSLYIASNCAPPWFQRRIDVPVFRGGEE